MTTTNVPNQQANSVKATATEILANAEFSLIENEGTILARLRFPPDTLRLGVRKLIKKIETAGGTIKKQECHSDRHPNLTSTWSQLLFQASVEIYERIQGRAKSSNLSIVRACTAKLMQQLQEETAAISMLETEAIVPATATGELASNEQLHQLTLHQLKKLGNVYGVPKKLRRTKRAIISQLLGQVTTAELSQS